MKVKTFEVAASPTARGDKKALSQVLDETVNAFFAGNPGIALVKYSVAGDLAGHIGRAIVSIVYEEKKEEKKIEEPRAPISYGRK